jgi:Arc/MetJ family transcription regulator
MRIILNIFTDVFKNKLILRTIIELDDALVEQAMHLSQIKTKKEVIQEALTNYVAWMKKKQLIRLKGEVKWEGNLKEMRSL